MESLFLHTNGTESPAEFERMRHANATLWAEGRKPGEYGRAYEDMQRYAYSYVALPSQIRQEIVTEYAAWDVMLPEQRHAAILAAVSGRYTQGEINQSCAIELCEWAERELERQSKTDRCQRCCGRSEQVTQDGQTFVRCTLCGAVWGRINLSRG